MSGTAQLRMNVTEWVRWLWQATSAGLALAFLLVVWQPGLLVPASKSTARASPSIGVVSSYAEAVQVATPAVVSIVASREAEDGPPTIGTLHQQAQVLGSGVVVSVAGHVLTNWHVVKQAKAIDVALNDGRTGRARLVGSDPETDLAVLAVDLPDVPIITIAEVDKLAVGDVVLAIGNPYGFAQTVTQGIVSATGRNRVGISTFENFIQTDAAINPGNSGGALVNTRGELLGIATAMVSPSGAASGIGFAIPAPMAIDVLHRILREGSVRRGWLGIAAADLSPEDARRLRLAGRSGVVIQGVLVDGPGHRVGLRPGDVLAAIDGEPIFDSTKVIEVISRYVPGSRARLEVLRAGRAEEIAVIVGERPLMSQ